MKNNVFIGEKIKKLRKKHKITQTQLAEKIDVKQSTISAIESNKTFPSTKLLVKLAFIFNVSLDYLNSEDCSDIAEVPFNFLSLEQKKAHLIRVHKFVLRSAYDILSTEEIIDILKDRGYDVLVK